jgi:uncharacterized protein YceH (UPF0502 family)
MSDLPASVFSESPLSAIEVRVLGCLIEKQFATPEVYPLTLNALVLACNQKTSREPLMNLAPGAVGQALRSLEGRGLARLVMGSRADRWEQRADKTLELVSGQVVLVGLLLLRGPQTLSELLSRSARLHEFEDLDAVQHSLERLISRGFAQHLGRQAGQREDRYTHALGDPAELQALLEARAAQPERASVQSVDDGRLAALEARLTELEARIAELEAAGAKPQA